MKKIRFLAVAIPILISFTLILSSCDMEAILNDADIMSILEELDIPYGYIGDIDESELPLRGTDGEQESIRYTETENMECSHLWTDATCECPSVCTLCGMSRGDRVDHSYEEIWHDENANCKNDIVVEYICKFCGDSYTRTYWLSKCSPTELYQIGEYFVGSIVVYDEDNNECAVGSCVLLEYNKVVTNFHLIGNASYAECKFGGEGHSVEYVLAYDKDIDIAVLKIEETGRISDAHLCPEIHEKGSIVYSIGGDKDSNSIFFDDAVVTEATKVINGIEYVQSDAFVTDEMSGGALMNEYSEIIGIITNRVVDGEGHCYALSVRELDKLVYGKPVTLDMISKTQK